MPPDLRAITSPTFQLEAQSEGLQQTAPPEAAGPCSAPGRPGPLSGKGASLLPVEWHISPVPAIPFLSKSLSDLANPSLAPGRGSSQPGVPNLPRSAAHSRTSDSAYRIPMEQASRRPPHPQPGSVPGFSLQEAAPAPPLTPKLPSSSPPPPPPPPDHCLPGLAPPSPSSQSVRLLSMVAARRRLRDGCLALPAPLCPPLPLACSSSLARSPLHGGRSCSARPPGAHTLTHGHTLTPARAPSQQRRCSPHPVCRRREPLAGFFWGGEPEGGRRGDEGRTENSSGLLAGKLGACAGGMERVLRETRPLLPRAEANPPHTLRRRRGPARGQVPSRALKITAGN